MRFSLLLFVKLDHDPTVLQYPQSQARGHFGPCRVFSINTRTAIARPKHLHVGGFGAVLLSPTDMESEKGPFKGYGSIAKSRNGSACRFHISLTMFGLG